jgi:hypothetical protein
LNSASCGYGYQTDRQKGEDGRIIREKEQKRVLRGKKGGVMTNGERKGEEREKEERMTKERVRVRVRVRVRE